MFSVAYLGLVAHEADDFVQRRFHEAATVTDHRNSQHRALPKIVFADLGNGQIELLLRPILDPAKDHSLFLKRMGFGQKQGQARNAHGHDVAAPGRRVLAPAGLVGDGRVENSGGGFDLEGLDDVLFLQVAVAVDGDTALVAVRDLAGVFLEPAQR